jgi:hypothetical protein
MDEFVVFQRQFAQLTLAYEQAVHNTWLISATLPTPITSESIAVWRAALDNENNIDEQRRGVLQKFLLAMNK